MASRDAERKRANDRESRDEAARRDARDDDAPNDPDSGEVDEDEEGDEDDDEPHESFAEWRQRPRNKLIIIAVAVAITVAIIWAISWYLESRKWAATANAYVGAPISRVAPGVAGHVARVFVRDNDVVRAGQPILELSGGSFAVSVQQAEAELAAARAQLLQAQAAARAARATVDEARATAAARSAEAVTAWREYRRYAVLSEAAVVEQQRSQALGQAQSAEATATAAQRTIETQAARADQAAADIVAARARVQQAEAALANARLNQGDTLLVAPIAGRITQFEIEPGDYVTPGQPAVAVVGMARWVTANFKENQLRLMRPGQAVEVTVDAWSDFPLAAVVDSVQAGTGSEFSPLPRQNATANWVETTQRVPVRIRFRPDAFRNFPARADVVPGLSAEVRVRIRD